MKDAADIITFAADIATRVLIEDEDLAIRVAAAQDSAEEVAARAVADDSAFTDRA